MQPLRRADRDPAWTSPNQASISSRRCGSGGQAEADIGDRLDACGAKSACELALELACDVPSPVDKGGVELDRGCACLEHRQGVGAGENSARADHRDPALRE